MKNTMTNIYGIAMTIYGGFVTALIAWLLVSDDIYVTTRPELLMVITGIPALVRGLNTLKKLWIANAISKKDKEIEEVKKDYQLTVVDKIA